MGLSRAGVVTCFLPETPEPEAVVAEGGSMTVENGYMNEHWELSKPIVQGQPNEKDRHFLYVGRGKDA